MFKHALWQRNEKQEFMKAFGKTMIVTGAGGGIGRQLVLQLLA
ncbi:MAG: hypothetical protein AB7S88_02825 [Candidatus Izemoplasmatales bacterium]